MPINESTFIRHGDGFLVSTRGYDDRQRLHFTDGSFQVLRQRDLTATHALITSHLGRPRLFTRDERIYLLGRNWTTPPRVMQLGLFRIDPATLTVTAHSILDNAEKENVVDGYYAMPYFRGSGLDTLLHVVDYKALQGRQPEIIRHEYRWDEVRLARSKRGQSGDGLAGDSDSVRENDNGIERETAPSPVGLVCGIEGCLGLARPPWSSVRKSICTSAPRPSPLSSSNGCSVASSSRST